MKILLNIMKYDYGDKRRGPSFEYDNFFDSLKKMGHSVDVFDYLSLFQKHGREIMNQQLLDVINKHAYDMILTSLHVDEFSPDFLLKLKNNCKQSVVWMNDDQWRWESLGKRVCFSFHHVITTDPDAIAKYRTIGYRHALLSQFACNTNIFNKRPLKKDIDVSFVGLPNPWRKFVVSELKKNGINIQCYGYGWPNGRITVREMVSIFNRSKINLNISNSVQYDLKYLTTFNFTWDRNQSLVRNLYGICGPQLNTLLSPKKNDQIKARLFEVTGAGGFTLTYPVEHLETYFNIPKDMVVYANTSDLTQKIQYYLKYPNKRETIAQSGYRTTITKHTYRKRFETLFKQIKLKA